MLGIIIIAFKVPVFYTKLKCFLHYALFVCFLDVRIHHHHSSSFSGLIRANVITIVAFKTLVFYKKR